MPAVPKPPIITVAPSRTSATAAATVATILLIMMSFLSGVGKRQADVAV